LLQLDDLMTSYTNARSEAGLFVRLPRSSRLRLRCRGRITRHSENAGPGVHAEAGPIDPL